MGTTTSTREAQPRPLDPERLPDHVDVLYRAAYALCGSREDAEDLVQEAYARVLAKPRLLRDGGELGYLLMTVRNVYFSGRIARTRRPSTVGDEDGMAAAPDPRPCVSEQVANREVFAAIATLPRDQRDVLVAVDVAGLSYAEAAQRLAVPIGTVMSRLYRARARIADAFAP